MIALHAVSSPQHAQALRWAATRFEATAFELVSDSAWASTYRLDGPGGSRWLKLLPERQRARLPQVLAVCAQLAAQVPAVIAADPDAGWLLCADHGGQCPGETDGDAHDLQLLAVVRGFATLQADVAGLHSFLAGFDQVDVAATPRLLLQFLAQPGAAAHADSGQVGAAYFIGEADAARYHRLLQARLALLQRHVAHALALPPTLAHGDLHSDNTAVRQGGQAVFFDWDEVAVGPAGLCLHGLLGGCALANALLARLAATGSPGDSATGQRLLAYVDALQAGGYANRALLLQGLGAAMCAGQARFITSFGRFPGESQRHAAANTLRARLSDLLDLCDWLASQNPETAQDCADDYEQAKEWRRAHRLVQDQLAHLPQPAALLARYALLCARLGDLATADEALHEAVHSAPDEPAWRLDMARLALQRLDLNAATQSLDIAQSLHAQAQPTAALRRRVTQFRRVLAAVSSADGWPCVQVSASERARGQLEPDTLALLVHAFNQCGAVQVDGAYEPAWVARLQTAFAAKYQHQFHDGAHADALKVGDKRYMLTLELDAEFGSPALVAPPLLMPVMRRLLGDELILGASTAVVSLPGSDDQRLHKDHSALFEEAGWQLPHPSFAAQIILPLLALDAVTGATRITKGSQRVPLKQAHDMPGQDPVVPLGSCVLLDYSVAHHGRGNRSQQVRPILNLIYARPWFRDMRNYHLQPPLKFSPAWFAAAPDPVRQLVAWWDLEQRMARRAAD